MTAPRVVNLRDKATLVETPYVRVDRSTKWGNPFKIGRDGDRDTVIEKYEAWIAALNTAGVVDITELRGKNLACWCAPLPCHADVLLRLANQPTTDGLDVAE